MSNEISISTSTILKILGIIAGIWFVVIIRDVVLLFIFAIILTSAIEPFASRLENRKIPRMLSVSIVYVLTIAILGAVIFFLFPPIVEQLRQLVIAIPEFVNSAITKFEVLKDLAAQHNFTANLENFIETISSALAGVVPNLFDTTKAFFGGLISFVIVLAISFYMSVEKGGLKQFVSALAPKKHSENVLRLVKKSQDKLGRWIKGQLVVILIIGLLDYVGLLLLGVRFALLLGITGAVLEIIPYAGPVIATIIAVLVGLSQSPMIALFAGIWFLVVQQIENHIITPKVMQTAVGLNPVVVILAILIGTKLAGVLGLVLAVPIAAVIEVFVSEFIET